MRHRVYGKKLGRTKNQRTALFRGLVRSLILHESITTTESKAKAIKGLVDRLISKSKQNTSSSKRIVCSEVPDDATRKKLVEVIAPRFTQRVSGFTSVIKLGMRKGDGSMMVRMNILKDEEGKEPKSDSQKASEEVSKE